MNPTIVHTIIGTLLVFLLGGLEVSAATTNLPPTAAGLPQMLDLTRFLRDRFVSAKSTNKTFKPIVGVQHYDGLPFNIEGRGWLYGRTEAQRNEKSEKDFPDFMGIGVGRTFDELHLLHGCRWQDGEEQPLAIVRLNYADGTQHEWQMKYGAHVRDWQRMPSEERETMSDTNTKVVWRSSLVTTNLKSTTRLFKTRLDNPFPSKTVTTLDFTTAKGLAAYDVVAATIANHDPKRPITPHVEPAVGDRTFSRTTTIRVLDQNGKPIPGVLLEPGVSVDGVGVIALPQYTSTNGEGVIRYPGMRTTSVSIRVVKAGFLPSYLSWRAKDFGDAAWQNALEYIALMKSFVPETNIVTLMPSNLPAASLIGSP